MAHAAKQSEGDAHDRINEQTAAQLIEARKIAQRAVNRARHKHPRTWADECLEEIESELGL